MNLVDVALNGGLAFGRMHEFYTGQSDDSAAAAGFASVLSIRATAGLEQAIWIRSRKALRNGGIVQGNGWTELGGKAERLLTIFTDDNMALLRATHDALRCPGACVVMVEAWGRMPELDLTAGRRLSLAAEKTGLALFLIRIDATPTPSAADTRWQVRSAPSRPLDARAPGSPAFDVELLRQRGGPAGLNWRLEWNRDRHEFGNTAISGASLPLPVRQPVVRADGDVIRRVA